MRCIMSFVEPRVQDSMRTMNVHGALFYRFLFAVSDNFSLSVTRVRDGIPHLDAPLSGRISLGWGFLLQKFFSFPVCRTRVLMHF